MIFDHNAYGMRELLPKFERLANGDKLPAELDWARLAREAPEATAMTLVAAQKPKLAVAFRAEWRRFKRGQTGEPSMRWAPRFRAAQKLNLASLPHLPDGSFLFQAEITLAQPMLTKDDGLFSVSDNAARRDRALQWPHIAASSWKGAFCSAVRLLGIARDKKSARSWDRIWGFAPESEAGDDEPDRSRAGRLSFCTTFFNRVDFRLLNPQDRVKRSGKDPVELEVVPEKERGWFQALYVPFDQPEKGAAEAEAVEDFHIFAHGTKAMLRDTGFGGKVSVGFGVAEDGLGSGVVAVRQAGVWHKLPVVSLSAMVGLKPWGERSDA